MADHSSAIVRAELPPMHAALLDAARLPPAPPDAGLSSVVQPILAIAAEALGFSRVSMWAYPADRSAIDLVLLLAGGQPSGTRMRLSAVEYPAYFKALERARVIAAEDAQHHPATKCFADGYLRPLGIGAMLDVPVFEDGVVTGVLCCEHVGPPRRFTAQDQHCAVSMADVAALRIERWRQARLQRELTERQRLLETTRRTEDLHWLVAGLAHDLKNLLQIASGNLELVAAAASADQALRIAKAQGAVDKAGELLQRIHQEARRRPAELVRVPLDALIEDLRPVLAVITGERVRLRIDTGGGCTLSCDRLRIEQVLLNLVGNACDAMPDGGTLAIGSMRTQAADGRAVARITVSDTGCGMPAEVVARLYEPFFTTKGPGRGTGLGLATVRRIIESHDGRIRCESVPGRGTVFQIDLPAL